MELQVALITNIVTLAIAVIIQVVTIRQTIRTLEYQFKQAEMDRKLRIQEAENARREAKRSEWKGYLIQLMQKLIEAREEYERFLGTEKTDLERHAAIIGKAIALCLAVNDEQMTTYANDELTPYFAEKKREDGTIVDWPSRNRNGMQAAVQSLAGLIKNA